MTPNQAWAFLLRVTPNKLFQFSIVDFLYLQNQIFPNSADTESNKTKVFQMFWKLRSTNTNRRESELLQ